MPSQRKRIGFLPSEEVQNIIEKICRANEYSQSKVTGLLVEEALRSRGVLSNLLDLNDNENNNFINNSFEKEQFSQNDKTSKDSDFYKINIKEFSDNIKMMHEFIEYKYFKKVMQQNNKFFD